MEVPEGMGASLKQYATNGSLKVNGRGVPKAVRVAAFYALVCGRPIEQEARENYRLMTALVGNVCEFPLDEYLTHVKGVYNSGCLGWQPDKDRLAYRHTPVVSSRQFLPILCPNQWLSKTVVFTDVLARPVAVVTMMCLAQPNKPNKWDLRSLTLYGMDEYGEDINRPIFVTPHYVGGFMAQFQNFMPIVSQAK